MRTLAPIALALLATSALAQTIHEWRTPDGKAFFGDRPPAGSVAVKQVDKVVGRVSTAPVPESKTAPTRPVYAWRDGVGCQDLTFIGVEDREFDGINRRIVRGTVKHDGNHVVRNVQVCGGGVCESLRGGRPMSNGETERFYLDVPSADPVPVRAECSILEPRG